MAQSRVRDVDTYISQSGELARPHLTELRKIIQSTVPDAEEKIWYNVPFYFYYGELVGFDAFTKHVSFGIGAEVFDDDYRALLEDKGYKTGKGTFQITFDQKIPTTIIKQLLKAKVKFNKTKSSMK